MPQVRIDAIGASQIEHVARQESRTNAAAANKLLAMGYQAWRGTATAAAATPVDGEATIRGRTIAAHISNATRAALEAFAEREERSLSSAMGILIRSGLRAHGITVQKGNDPVGTNTRSADLETAA